MDGSKTGLGVIITMMLIMALGKLYNWYAVKGITTAESSNNRRNSRKKKISPKRLAYFPQMGNGAH
jgi:hypothetical protein